MFVVLYRFPAQLSARFHTFAEATRFARWQALATGKAKVYAQDASTVLVTYATHCGALVAA